MTIAGRIMLAFVDISDALARYNDHLQDERRGHRIWLMHIRGYLRDVRQAFIDQDLPMARKKDDVPATVAGSVPFAKYKTWIDHYGNPRELRELVKDDPGWAAHRIRYLSILAEVEELLEPLTAPENAAVRTAELQGLFAKYPGLLGWLEDLSSPSTVLVGGKAGCFGPPLKELVDVLKKLGQE